MYVLGTGGDIAHRNHGRDMTNDSTKQSTTIERLDPGDLHVWLADPDAPAGQGDHAGEVTTLLDTEEAERYRAFRFETDRRTYLAAHVLLRMTLSRYAPVAPQDWSFVANAYGRPELACPDAQVPLRFNLSHTHGLVACAVTRTDDIGVDVEDMSRHGGGMDVAERFFAPQEVAWLRRARSRERTGLFFTIWTLKESYIKARGMGLALDLDSFAFDLSNPDAPRVTFNRDIGDDPSSWWFHVEPIGRHHMMALALRHATRVRPLVRWAAWLGG